MTEGKMLWMGRPIEDLSREELLTALRTMFRLSESQQEAHRSTLRMWDLCRSAR
jgi:hypothetical protein